MTAGTKSVLMGAHAFWLHPFFVAWGWGVLYGFPWDPRLWFAFFLHDIGYIGLPNIDGPEGEKHPELGANIMHSLFDRPVMVWKNGEEEWSDKYWYDLTLYHSRFYAKKAGKPYSRLCVADKLAFALTPKWLYLPMVRFTGELEEYITDKKYGDDRSNYTPSEWFDRVASWAIRFSKDNLYDHPA